MYFHLPIRRGVALVLTTLLVLTFLPALPHTYAQDASAIQTIESDDPRVIQAGTWSSQGTDAASNGSYLFSGGAEEDVLALAFVGSAIEIVYVGGPQLGTLAIEVDGTVLRTVITTTEKIEYGQVAKVDYLSDEPHNVKVYAQKGGVVAVDAFRIIPFAATAGVEAVNFDDTGDIQASTCSPVSDLHRVSYTSTGAEPFAPSFNPSISATGRYVAFTSFDQLVPLDDDVFMDVYVVDRQTCAVQLVSVSSLGEKGNDVSQYPNISADGRYIAFDSEADNLVVDDDNDSIDVFVHDRQTGTTTRVSVATGGVEGNDFSYSPVLSSNGRYVAFDSDATNLVAGDTNLAADVFVHDRQTNITTRVSVATGGTQATGGDSAYSWISSDGRYVTFHSDAVNLVPNDNNVSIDIFVHDRQTNTTTRVSVATGGGQANDSSGRPVISADGRYVAFLSDATNLVVSDTNNFTDVFLHDRNTGSTTRVSVSTGGAQGNDESYLPSISGDGSYVAFVSDATNLDPADLNTAPDTYVYNRNLNTTTLVSVPVDNSLPCPCGTSAVAISADGRYVAFDSGADNLINNDTNLVPDVFVAPRIVTPTDTLALFQPTYEIVGVFDTLADNPAAERLTTFSAYAPPTTAGQWVMGDWNGDGLKTPGVYMNGPFWYTNKLGEPTTAADWRSLWIGISGPPVAGRFNGALPNDCIGAVQSANFPPFGTAFVLYYTCDLSGNTAPTISFQWLSVVLPDSGGFTGTHQFGAGDFDGDGDDSVAVRRGTSIAFGNTAPAQGNATFDLAQYIGAPQAGADAGILVVGDWDASGAASFGLFYQNGEFFYRNDLIFNSGTYVNQSVGAPLGGNVQATTWR